MLGTRPVQNHPGRYPGRFRLDKTGFTPPRSQAPGLLSNEITPPFKFPLNPAANPTTIQKTDIISGNT